MPIVVCICDRDRVRLYERGEGGETVQVADYPTPRGFDPEAITAFALGVGTSYREGIERQLGNGHNGGGNGHGHNGDDVRGRVPGTYASAREMAARYERVSRVLADATEPLTSLEIATRAELPEHRKWDVNRMLKRLMADGVVERRHLRGNRGPYVYVARR